MSRRHRVPPERAAEQPAHAPEPSARDAPSARPTVRSTLPRATWPWWLALLAIVVLGAWVRIGTALGDPNFRRDDARGMLRTDPALLYYVTERIVESGGAPPPDLRADPRIEHPETSDWAAMETVGQEFVVAWSKLLVAPETPLHVVATWTMGIFAALAAIGVFGLARELTGRPLWGLFAALLYSVSSANYRTIGFVLIREDFSFPWFALHLWMLARAARLRTTSSIVLCAVPLALALATWHAMTFVVTLEAACVLAWHLRTGENPLAARRAWLVPAILAVAAVAVPVLQSKLFLLSLPMQVLVALLLSAAIVRKRAPSRAGALAVSIGSLVLVAIAATLVSRALSDGGSDYSHVYAFMRDKILRLGVRPADPLELGYESRLLWQGPFQTGSPIDFLDYPFAALLLLPAFVFGASRWFRGRGDARENLLVLFAFVSVVMAFLVQRLMILPGLVAPVVAACVLAQVRPAALGIGVMTVGLIAQATYFERLISRYVIIWYWPPQRVEELARVITFVEKNVPAGEPVATDYNNSPAILAHTRRPVLYQPKYETLRSRRKIEAFDRAFFHGTPDELKQLLLAQGARWLVVDRQTMLATMMYTAGIARPELLQPGTPAAAFLGGDERALTGVPGFRLAYRSPPALRLDMFRIYALE